MNKLQQWYFNTKQNLISRETSFVQKWKIKNFVIMQHEQEKDDDGNRQL